MVGNDNDVTEDRLAAIRNTAYRQLDGEVTPKYSSRFVTHMDVTRSDIDVFVAALKAYLCAPALSK